MTVKPTPPGPQLGRTAEADSPSTLRSIEAADVVPPDDESAAAPVYFEPQALVAVSDHKTIEVETVKLAEDIDPRKLPTELRLARPISIVPPDSGWPQSEVVVVSSQPPSASRRRWRAPALLLGLLAALLVLVLARGVVRRSQAASPAPSAAVAEAPHSAAELATPASVPTLAATATAAPEALVEASPPSSTSASAPVAPKPPVPAHANSPHGVVKVPVHPGAAPARTGATPALSSTSKPKRAIY